MQNYTELLKRAMERVSKKVSTRERFQIPNVVIEIQGPKTLVRNFNEIAQKLRRDKKHIAKYLAREIGVPGNVQGNMLVLQGRISREILQKKIESYVKEFVYCKVCGEPDTKLVKEGRLSFLKCEACGARSPARSKI
jgi:translation initiation factor 2 subunit 2